MNQLSEELEKIKLDPNHRDGTLLGITDIINTKVINAIEKIDKMMNGQTTGWITSSTTEAKIKIKYFKGKEQRGVGINIEPLKKY